MTQEIPIGEWKEFLTAFGRERHAWPATIHVVDAHGAVRRSTPVRLKSATGLADAVRLEFLDEQHALCVRRPRAVRIQQTDAGSEQALEVETEDGQCIRLAFRTAALPEQLDGRAPGEVSPSILSLLTALFLLFAAALNQARR